MFAESGNVPLVNAGDASSFDHGLLLAATRMHCPFRIFFLLLGTMLYGLVFQPEWSAVEAAYFSACTLMTIGFGDYMPTNQWSKTFTVVYIFGGLGLAATFISLVTARLDTTVSAWIVSVREGAARKSGLLRAHEAGGSGTAPANFWRCVLASWWKNDIQQAGEDQRIADNAFAGGSYGASDAMRY